MKSHGSSEGLTEAEFAQRIEELNRQYHALPDWVKQSMSPFIAVPFRLRTRPVQPSY